MVVLSVADGRISIIKDRLSLIKFTITDSISDGLAQVLYLKLQLKLFKSEIGSSLLTGIKLI